MFTVNQRNQSFTNKSDMWIEPKQNIETTDKQNRMNGITQYNRRKGILDP